MNMINSPLVLMAREEKRGKFIEDEVSLDCYNRILGRFL